MKNTDPVLHSRHAVLTPPLRRSALALLVSSCFSAAYANPTLPQVVNGQATFNQQGNVFSITNTPGTIINWQSFSINPGELTRFIQQNANSAVLNRITGQDPSKILGALQSNGKVYLINPNGVLFGRDARVDVNGLVASSLGLSNQDFLAGKMNFSGAASAGAVSNQGTIHTGAGGKVALIGPNVVNSGVITAPNGEVILAAGHSVQLADPANPGLQVVVSAPSDQALNVGQVIAQGGKIGMYGALLNQRGTLNANSAVIGENGKIVLQASGKALLEAGSLTSATNSAGSGGQVTVLGDQVGLTGNARVDVSGAKGGGTVLLGGDYQGRNAAIPNARQVYLGSDATVAADAIDSGNGGKVIVWGDQTTRVFGSISAHGGAASGDGGFVETSGHYLAVDGIRVDTRSSRGKQGNWLLDPYDIEVVAGNGGMLGDVDQFGDAPASGSTSIGASLISNATSNVTLQALHRITFNSAINMTQAGVGLTAQAGESINVNTAITTNGGAVKLSANDASSGSPKIAASNVNLGAAISTHGGAVTISGANVVGLGSINVGSGNLALIANEAGGGINLTGTGDQLSGSGAAGQTVSLQADTINFSGGINFGGAASQASVTLLPLTNGRAIFLGTTAGNALGLLNEELNRISAGSLNIGNSNSGNISTFQTIDLAQTTTGTGVKNLTLESGGNIIVSNPLTMRQAGSSLLLKTGVGGTLAVDGGGSLSAANLFLEADQMSLGGSAGSLSGDLVTLDRRSAGEIDVGSGAADSSTSLGLTDAELKTIGAGHITIGGHTFNGPLNLLGSLDLSGLSSLNLLELRTSGALRLGGPLIVGKDLMVAGSTINATGLVNVGGEFILDGGAWLQNSGSLPAFYAHGFNLQNGTFLRVTGGDGSSASPYRIADIYGLQGINTLGMANNYALVSNIDASGTAGWNQGGGFVSIASGNVSGYSGTFDGAGHVISGLTVSTANQPGTSGVGLFARLQGGTLRNLALQGGSVTGRYNVGALVGLNDGGTLDNVFSSSTVNGTNAVGGLVGANSGTIRNSGASGNVNGVNSDGGGAVGGLAGTNFGSGLITVSSASGAVNGARESVGGLVGSNQARITQSYATGNVSGARSVGGLVGNNGAGGTISDAYASGAVGLAAGADATLVHENLGGLAGSNSGAISNVFSSGAINGSGFTAVGGVLGANAGGTLSGAYWNTDSSGQHSDNGGATGLSTAQMQQQSSFGGFNFGNSAVWRIYNGHTTPLLKAFLKPLQVNVSGAAGSKVYDGQFAMFNGTLVYIGLLDGDTGVNGSLGYQSARNVGSYALDGLWSTKYDISISGANVLSITPRVLGVTVGGSKVYDGSTGFGGATYSLSNVVEGDHVHASGNAQFLDKNAGNGKTVNASGLSLSGNELGNYVLASDTASGSADISRATLNLGNVSGINKVYDGSSNAAVNAALLGLFGNDQVSLADLLARFSDKNAGRGKTVNYSGSGALSGLDAGNYVLGAYSGSISADITARALNLSYSGGGKVYDGSSNATLNVGDDRVAGDALSVSLHASFADKNAGNNKVVSINSVSLGGADAGNYTLVLPSGNWLASITPAALVLNGLSAGNKVYDGSNQASVSASLGGVIGQDQVNLVGGSGSFSDKNAGSGKVVTASGFGLSGADAGNYTLVSNGGTTHADIAQKALSTWVGAGGGLWSDAANWDGGVVPEGANVLAVDFGGLKGTVTYNAAAGDTILNNLNMLGGLNLSGGNLSVGNGNLSSLNLSGGGLQIGNSLTVGNYLQSGGLLSGLGNVNISNSFSQSAGSINIGGKLTIKQASGDLNFANLTAQTVSLSASSGAIGQSGAINAGSLDTQSQNGVVLNNAGNHVGNFSASNSGAGGITLVNTGPASGLLLGSLSSGSGNITVNNTGAVETHAINANGGNVSITAHSPINVQGAISGNDITLAADTDIAFGNGAQLNAAHNIAATAGNDITLDGAAGLNAGNTITLTSGRGVFFRGQSTLDVQAGGGINLLAQNGNISGTPEVRINSRGAPVSLLAPKGSISMPSSIFVGVPPPPPSVPTASQVAQSSAATVAVIQQGNSSSSATGAAGDAASGPKVADKDKTPAKPATSEKENGNPNDTKKMYCS
ncbi:YDG domain-containing protein [Janthinobacterium agaricidamnosum]|uniref:Filamentous haemagglutinin family N-terminal domain protein n=1 Tax=Janthinobacterium agaricidamnosum NBRC 102515 = DSM 9628 TaxID=1349767 RepID=W0V8I9_9BURK|nr:YDG domain-containing protein [Janthinobacterium agaricidamnosum]CDG84201.1 filamentous haemagglutinin family N-terminal domain protein [Janthinobacterium agaricidamnosum NBRC 102515 = DSM 9628]